MSISADVRDLYLKTLEQRAGSHDRIQMLIRSTQDPQDTFDTALVMATAANEISEFAGRRDALDIVLAGFEITFPVMRQHRLEANELGLTTRSYIAGLQSFEAEPEFTKGDGEKF